MTPQEILNRAIRLVPAVGWKHALQASCQSFDLPSIAANGLAQGPPFIAVIEHYIASINDELELKIKNDPVFKTLGTTEKLKTACWTRLQCMTPLKPYLAEALSLIVEPPHSHRALSALGQTSHLIWRLAGDTSVDMNWYSKRMLLGGVLASTEIYFTMDHSPDFEQTRGFLDRRLQDALHLGYTANKMTSHTEMYLNILKDYFLK